MEKQIAQAIEQLAAGDFHSRWDHAKQLSQQFAQWGNRVIPPLIHELKAQQDPDIQWFLVRILSEFDHPAIVPALAQLLVTTESEDLQIAVSKALSTLGDRAVDPLSELLAMPVDSAPPATSLSAGASASSQPDSQPDSQRLLAARTLAYIRRGAIIEPLLSITDDPNPELRAIAIEALGSFHDSRITPVLFAALHDKSTICIEAIRTLGRRRDLLATTDLVGPLQQCLLAANVSIACESAIALGRLGSDAAVAVLGNQLTAPLPTAVRIAIARALGWLNTPSAVGYLASAFASPLLVIVPDVQQSIAQALGQTHDIALRAIAAAPLIQWLSVSQLADRSSREPAPHFDPFPLLQAVLLSLARLGATEAIDSLIPVLSNPDSRIRMHALSALKQIDPRASQAQAQRYLHRLDSSPVEKKYVMEALAAW